MHRLCLTPALSAFFFSLFFFYWQVSAACPTGQSWLTVNMGSNIQSLIAGHDLLWAITTDNTLLARSGISRHNPGGIGWEPIGRMKVQYASLGFKSYAWCINKNGVACFMGNVSTKSPSGDERWWQVALGQYVQDSSFMESLWSWSWAKRNDPLMMVAAGEGKICAMSSASLLHCCSSSMEGTLYRAASPPGLAQSSVWECVAASGVYGVDGLIWAVRPNGELFCFQRGKRATAVEPPKARHTLHRLSVSSAAVWGLTTAGEILERTGLSDYCPEGTGWKLVPVDAFGGAKVVDFSCGLYWVWAVDEKGYVWLRHGPLAVAKLGWQRIEPVSWTSRIVRVRLP